MIEYLKSKASNEDVFKVINPVVGNWFKNKFKGFSDPQKYAIIPIHNKENILVSAVTGSGKTLTAFTSILSELITFSENDLLENQIYAVYISPLKALSNDVEFNLNQPLKEMESESKKDFNIKVAVRTGDTTQSEKSKMLRKTPHILITTPESFSIVLTSPKLKEKLRSVKWVIIDEIHALAESKRGVHLSLALERLEDLSQNFTRIGLSATAEPIEDIARFLVGSKRKCKIAKVELKKNMDIKVLSPVPDLINVTHKQMHNEMYDLIDNLIQEHKTTLVFTNTRSATERVVHHLKERFPKKYTENIGAHHGSLSKEHRLDMETRMREGKLKAIVCSTSLELGIDIGYIDLVILLGSPKSVARCTQRFGRAGHRLHDTIKGRIIVLDRDDLVECSILLKNVIEGKIDRIHIPENCLDVLAQQIYGIAISEKISEKDLWKMITSSYCYRNLKYSEFLEILDYLSGEYTKLEDRHVYAKIWYDKESGMIGKRSRLARMIYMTNIGTIPDETHVQVKIGEQVIGKIDEAFLERLKRGDVFVLGGNKYEFLFSRGMTAQVKTAEMRPPTIPSWFSEMLPLSFDLANDISKFRGLMEKKFNNEDSKEEIMAFLSKYLYLDKNAENAIYEYLRQQYLFEELPNDKKILVEEYKEDNKKFIVFHTLYGRKVNDVLSRAVAYIIGRLYHIDVEIGISDNGFYVSSEKTIIVSQVFEHLKLKDIDSIMKNAIDKTEVLKRRFRHCAVRSLMILRNYGGRTKRVGRQQVSSMLLLNAVRRISEDFPILKESRREVLDDLMDLENAKIIIENIENKKIEVKTFQTKIPSPFAFNLVLEGYIDIMKMEDKVEFLRRMHHLVLAKIGKTKKIE
ncbi:ATP-dependent helicase [Candidatus Woesearchaeota archaeon]|nr:ATP-dependent helicase [Candidatus Woesearchaeota archaeon]